MSSNFSDYIDANKFAIKPHTSQLVKFDFQNAKPFHRVTVSDQLTDSINHYNHSVPVVPQKPFTYASTLGNPKPQPVHNISKPFSFMNNYL